MPNLTLTRTRPMIIETKLRPHTLPRPLSYLLLCLYAHMGSMMDHPGGRNGVCENEERTSVLRTQSMILPVQGFPESADTDNRSSRALL